MKRVVLLGGGHAHLRVLADFAATPAAGAALTLVLPFPALTCSGKVAGVVAGHCRADEGLIPLRPPASAARAAFVEASAAALDAAARRITLSNGAVLGYDVLSIDTGSAAPEGLRGSGLALDDAGFIATGPTLQSSAPSRRGAAGSGAGKTTPTALSSRDMAAGRPTPLNRGYKSRFL